MALSEKQIKSIVEATHRFNVWVGAVRSGKTFASIIKLIDLLKNGPPGDVMIIGVNRESIGRNVLSDLYKLLGVPKPSDKITRVRLYNRDVYFVGAHDEGSVRRIQGATLAIAYVDEVACVPQPFFRMLESRLSIKGAQLLATANPEGPSHWLKKQYIDRQGDESLDLISWHFTLDDNPALDQKYKESLKASFTGMWYKRLILGEWAVSHGLIFDAYDHLNTFREEVTPTKWPQIRVVDEYYYDSVKEGRQKTDDELADDIYKLCRFNQVRAVYVDPSAASLKIELRNRNLPVLDAKNDVLEGIKVVSKFVANKNLVIHESCKTLIEVIQSYCWDPKAADRGEDKPLKKREHCMDALRYLCFSAFPQGSFGHPDENLTIDQIRRQVYSDDEHDAFGSMAHQGYF